MNNFKTELESIESTENIADKLVEKLPEISKFFIVNRPENDNFINNPDDPKEHRPKWHQWGIITHTKKFLEYYRTKVPQYLEQWGVKDKIDEKLAQNIDGRSKAELLEISIVLHDLGKFDRDFIIKDGKPDHDFDDHELKSKEYILYHEDLNQMLKNSGLTNKQLIYIAECVSLHYELSKIRRAAKKSEEGFNINFVHSKICQEACKDLIIKYPEYKEEIGLLYFGDSLAKTEVVINAETQHELDSQDNEIKKIIVSNNFSSSFFAGIKQTAVNIQVLKKYFQLLINN